MATPATYATRADFAQYLAALNPHLFESMSWSVAAESFGPAIDAALFDLGMQNVSDANGRSIRHLQLLGEYWVWYYALQAVTGNRFNFSNSKGSFSVGDTVKQIERAMRLSQDALSAVGGPMPGYVVSIRTTRGHRHPYAARYDAGGNGE